MTMRPIVVIIAYLSTLALLSGASVASVEALQDNQIEQQHEQQQTFIQQHEDQVVNIAPPTTTTTPAPRIGQQEEQQEEQEVGQIVQQVHQTREMSTIKAPSRQQQQEVVVQQEQHQHSSSKAFVYGAVDGVAGVAFPALTSIPNTKFTCDDKPFELGMYADEETGCQAYHMCYKGRRESFLCGTGTIFNQAILSCDFWYSTNCTKSAQHYSGNTEFGSATKEPVASRKSWPAIVMPATKTSYRPPPQFATKTFPPPPSKTAPLPPMVTEAPPPIITEAPPQPSIKAPPSASIKAPPPPPPPPTKTAPPPLTKTRLQPQTIEQPPAATYIPERFRQGLPPPSVRQRSKASAPQQRVDEQKHSANNQHPQTQDLFKAGVSPSRRVRLMQQFESERRQRPDSATTASPLLVSLMASTGRDTVENAASNIVQRASPAAASNELATNDSEKDGWRLYYARKSAANQKVSPKSAPNKLAASEIKAWEARVSRAGAKVSLAAEARSTTAAPTTRHQPNGSTQAPSQTTRVDLLDEQTTTMKAAAFSTDAPSTSTAGTPASTSRTTTPTATTTTSSLTSAPDTGAPFEVAETSTAPAPISTTVVASTTLETQQNEQLMMQPTTSTASIASSTTRAPETTSTATPLPATNTALTLKTTSTPSAPITTVEQNTTTTLAAATTTTTLAPRQQSAKGAKIAKAVAKSVTKSFQTNQK